MKYGLVMFPTDYSIGPAELAKAAEERGFESLWFPEHTHIPASRLSQWPGGGELPPEYSHCLDPFVAMAAAFTATEKLKVGPGICLVIEHDPIVLAKVVASLDHMSGGRVLFGIGGGWNREEMADHGTDFSRRWKVLRERVEAMKAIWSEEEATYHGEFVNFDNIWSWPKPVQKPHPPVVVGGNGERTLQRVARYGDEWMPINRAEGPPVERIPELQEMAAKAGRGPIPVGLFFARSDPAEIGKYRDHGISRSIFGLPSAGADEILPRLDKLAEVMKQAG